MLLLTANVHAQRNPFYNLNVENGLIQSQVTAITQDRFGYLWIGTLGGLSRYDGSEFTNYTVRDGLPNNTINALATDSKGNLWIGTSKGAAVYNGRTFRHFAFDAPENTNANIVTEIVVSADTAWCRAGGKLYSIAQGRSHQISLPNKNVIVTSLLVDGHALRIGCTNGLLYTYRNNKWDSLVINEPSLSQIPIVLSMYKDSKEKTWIGTNAGLYTIDSNKIHVAKSGSLSLFAIPSILSITEAKNGSLWLATASGAIRLAENGLTYYNKHNGLTDNTINKTITDAEGNIWLASDGRGLFRFSGAQFTVLDESMGLPSGQIMSIASYYNRLYLGTYDAGLYAYDGNMVYAVAMPLKPAPAIICMRTRKGELWLGTRGAGLWRYNGLSFKSYYAPTIISNAVTNLYTDTLGRLWIGFPNGAMLYEHDTFHRLSMTNTAVQDFISIGNDSTLLATNDGIKLYHDGVVMPFRTNAAPDSAFAQCFTRKGNELWIGTSDNGVIYYNLATKQSLVINKSNGLKSDFVYNIITDNEGNIWLGTGFGIHRVHMQGNTPVIAFYGKEQGITGMESNHNAVYKMPDGSLWFGTTNGALHYYPKSNNIKSQPISIVLQSVKIFGQNITDTSYFDSTDAWNNVPYHLHLPYKKNNITFTFQAISLSGAEQIHYRYHIEGLDTRWSDWSTVNSVTYSALPPGKYVLRVECITNDNSEVRELSYPFEIITPFEKTGLFRLIVLAGCILLGITIQYIVNKRKQHRLTLLDRLRREEQAKVRMRTAEDFHDEIGNKLTRINVLTSVLQKKMGYVSPEAKRILEQITENTGQLYSGTKDILWSLKPSNDNLYEIILRLRDFGFDLFQDTDVHFTFEGEDRRWNNYRLPMDVSRNVIMIFKEALNNCLKYSGATEVKLEAQIRDFDALNIVLTDNGKGFDIENTQKGHGIDNMNVRAKRIHGRLYIDTWPGRGTSISLTFRLPAKI